MPSTTTPLPSELTSRYILELMRTTPKFRREPDQDYRPGQATDVHACAWTPLGGASHYYAEGVDPNVDPSALRLKFYELDFMGYRYPGQTEPTQLYP